MKSSSNLRQFALIRDASVDRIVLDVFGDVDVASATEVREAIERTVAEDDGAEVVIDLTKCRYFDSSGVGVLVFAYKRLGARLSVVVNPTSQVYRILQIVQFERLFPLKTSAPVPPGLHAGFVPASHPRAPWPSSPA